MARRPVENSDLTKGALRKTMPVSVGAFLEFTEGEEQGRRVPLLYVRTVLGRKFGDVLVPDIRVSASHAAIEFTGRGFRLVDLGSANGTFIGNRKIKESEVEPDQDIRIGSLTFRIRLDPTIAAKLSAQRVTAPHAEEGGMSEMLRRELFAQGIRGAEDRTLSVEENSASSHLFKLQILDGPDRGKKFDFRKTKFTIGRVDTDLNLNDQDVSRKHALIEVDEGGQALLRDLASTNGTFLNERRISNAVLSDGDRIMIGRTKLLFKTGAGP